MGKKLNKLFYSIYLYLHILFSRNPNNANDEYVGAPFEWKSYGSERNYLDLGDELVISQNLFSERFHIWDKLFPLEKYLGK